jgi:hypothetical protein
VVNHHQQLLYLPAELAERLSEQRSEVVVDTDLAVAEVPRFLNRFGLCRQLVGSGLRAEVDGQKVQVPDQGQRR